MTGPLNPEALDHAAKEMRKAVHLGAEWRDAAGVAIIEYHKAESKEEPHAVNRLNQPLRCSVDNGYLDATDSPPRTLKCEVCGRVYSYPGGYEIK